MIYGTIRFTYFGQPLHADLTDLGWLVPDDPDLATTFDLLASPSDFGPADGSPTAAAVMKAARIYGGSYELAPLPGPPPGTVF